MNKTSLSKRKPLLVIATPNAGTNAKTIADVVASLVQNNVPFELHEVKDPPAVHHKLRQVSSDEYAAVAVFGGDGTVIQVLKVAYIKQLPVLILPGGTANALAKSVGMPKSIEECVHIFAQSKYALKYINVALINDQPFILDLHAGIWADAIKATPRASKQKFGALAYYSRTFKQFRDAKRQHYELEIDGQMVAMDGYACMIANEGQHRVLGLNLFSWPNAGAISVAIIRTSKLSQLLTWYMARMVAHRNLDSVVRRWRTSAVTITQFPRNLIVDDDAVTLKLPLELSISPYAAMLIAPLAPESNSLKNLWLQLKVTPYRAYDHLLRNFLGAPDRNFSQVSAHLYIGGAYRPSAYRRFKEWGVTGIVNMQERLPPTNLDDQFKILHLPTRDHTAPTIEALTKGVNFITEQVAAGGAVYVHCHLGEGRGPTMAAAYLMSKGMKLEDAVTHIRRFRPFVRPNRMQVRQLARWSEEYLQK